MSHIPVILELAAGAAGGSIAAGVAPFFNAGMGRNLMAGACGGMAGCEVICRLHKSSSPPAPATWPPPEIYVSAELLMVLLSASALGGVFLAASCAALSQGVCRGMSYRSDRKTLLHSEHQD